MAAPAQLRFARDATQLSEFLLQLKLIQCPHCGANETLNAHGPLRGYAESTSEVVIRGWRIYCSNRRQRQGCGRTFATLLAGLLWGCLVRAQTLLDFVKGVLGGASKAAAWKRSAPDFSQRSGYRLWQRLSEQQPRLRSLLCCHASPVASDSHESLQALYLHLDAVCQSESLFAAFQDHFQEPLLV